MMCLIMNAKAVMTFNAAGSSTHVGACQFLHVCLFSLSHTNSFEPEPPLSTMLLNLDITYLICEELDPAKVDQSNGDGGLSDARTARTTLLSLGLTNKACLDPALNVLWREIHSMDLVLYFIMTTKSSGSGNKVLAKFPRRRTIY